MEDEHGPGGSGHEHQHEHEHEHEHGGPPSLRRRLATALRGHSHDPGGHVDTALQTSRAGMRALWVSVLALGATGLAQAAVVLFTGSVALLSDTLHNLGDALTAVPLAVAFWLGRRPRNDRYTYGYGRSEDLAGVVIVLVVAASAVAAGWESARRLLSPQPVSHVWAVALAGLVGFAGNELVARHRVRVGRRIGSAALVADGLHARTDGFTSLAVVVGAAGEAAGLTWADPAVGLLITLAILVVLREATRDVYRRLMDAVDPELVARVIASLADTAGVEEVGDVRLRWIGHALRAECEITVRDTLTVAAGHAIAHEAEHRLLHDIGRLTSAIVHANPTGEQHHELTAHHNDDPGAQH